MDAPIANPQQGQATVCSAAVECYGQLILYPFLDSQDRPLITISLFVLFRVKFETQQAANAEEIPLVTAAKTVFDSSDPSFWSLSALVVPRPLLPVIKLLARKFPSKLMQKSQNAFETLYDASNALIEVSLQILLSDFSTLQYHIVYLHHATVSVAVTVRVSHSQYYVPCMDHATAQQKGCDVHRCCS